jgi:hypothetical protein
MMMHSFLLKAKCISTFTFGISQRKRILSFCLTVSIYGKAVWLICWFFIRHPKEQLFSLTRNLSSISL